MPRPFAAVAFETTTPAAPFADRVLQKVVRVELLADERDEQIARLDRARVGPDAAETASSRRGRFVVVTDDKRVRDAVGRPEHRLRD